MQARSGPSTFAKPSHPVPSSFIPRLRSDSFERRRRNDGGGDLDEYIVAPGEAEESSILKALRAMRTRPLAVYSEARPGTCRTQEHEGETELAWGGPLLVWSRGPAVVRSYTFAEDIVQALWASIQRGGPKAGIHTRSHRPSTGAQGPEGERLGPFSRSDATHGAPRPSPLAQSSGSRHSQSGEDLERALVVVLQTTIIIYFPRLGEEYSVSKTFRLQNAFPALPSGILFHRAPEGEDYRLATRSPADENAVEQLPFLFYLGHHLHDFVPVPIVSGIAENANGTIQVSGSSRSFSDINETVLYVSADLPAYSSQPEQKKILITVNTKAEEIRIYAYTADCDAASLSRMPQTHSSPERAARNHDTDAAETDITRYETSEMPSQGNATSRMSAGPPFASSTTAVDASMSSVAALGKGRPNAAPRRSARLSNAANRESSTSTAPPLLRRRSSRYPSVADVGNMSRIEESFSQPVPSSGAGATSAGIQAESGRMGDAVEAEEMGQIVEGMARNRTSSSAASALTNPAGRGGGPTGANGRTPLDPPMTRQRRASQMARTPYITRTASRAPSSTYARRRTSRPSAPPQDAIEGDPNSFYSTHLTGASMMTPAASTDQANIRTALGETVLPPNIDAFENDLPTSLEACRGAALQHLDTVSIPGLQGTSGVRVWQKDLPHAPGVQLLYICANGRLFCRVLDRTWTNGPSCVSCVLPVSSGIASERPVVDAAAITDSSGYTYILDLTQAGTLLVRCSDSIDDAPIELGLRRSRLGKSVLSPLVDSTRLHIAGIRSISDRSHYLQLSISGEERPQEVSFDLAPADLLVDKLLRALDSTTRETRPIGSHIRRSWILARMTNAAISDWEALRAALFGPRGNAEVMSCTQAIDDTLCCLLEDRSLPFGDLLPCVKSKDDTKPVIRPRGASSSDIDLCSVLLVVHAMAQDAQLDTVARETDLPRLVALISPLASFCRATVFQSYWSRSLRTVKLTAAIAPADHNRLPFEVVPADVTNLLCATASGSIATRHGFMRAFAKGSTFAFMRPDLVVPRALRLFDVLRRGPILRNSLQLIGGGEVSDRVLAAADTAMALASHGFDRTELESLPMPLALILHHALHVCARSPPEGLPAKAYNLIGRNDISAQLDTGAQDAVRAFSSQNLRTLPTNAKFDPLSAMLFSKDRRLQDVVEMLSTNRPTALRAFIRSDKDEHENKDHALARMGNVADRIKASPIGRGMLLMLTKKFDPTQKWQTPRLNLRITLKPHVPCNYNEPRPDAPEMEWPEFHNGAASALEMVVTKGKVDSTWYFSQSAGERSPRHAGLLLGLGLAGHFATIGQVHTYRYLGDRHNLTSIGLLLGLSATFVGQGDPDVRALLACHVKAFLPPHSVNLSHSTLVQSAALLGTGLLFLGSDVHHIAEALCEQIGAQFIETTDPQTFCRDAYSLSAALGLGLVMLGKGRRRGMSSARDRRLLDRLEHWIVGPVTTLFPSDAHDPMWKVDLRITSAPAALAYGLIFLRSNQRSLLDGIRLPETASEMDRIRPDNLISISIARNLIMWDEMSPTQEWLESTYPAMLKFIPPRDRFVRQQAVYSIMIGSAFALALKYAGSADVKVKRFLTELFNTHDKISRGLAECYQSHVCIAGARSLVDVLALCLGIVMAGSGDLETLKLLRLAHVYGMSHQPYATHLATQTALGLLFLGGGRYTFGRSDACVAALLISCYPRFPIRSSDNRAHLQAYRHLWMLAVEPRLIVTQDVDSREVAHVPISIVNASVDSGSGQSGLETTTTTMTPHQLPHLNRVRSIMVDSERYWKTTLATPESGSEEKAHQAKVGQMSATLTHNGRAAVQTLFVKRKLGYLDYSVDPSGLRSALLLRRPGHGGSSLPRDASDVGIEGRSILEGGTPGAGAVSSLLRLLREAGEGPGTAAGIRPEQRLLLQRLLLHSEAGNHAANEDLSDLARVFSDAFVECLRSDNAWLLPTYVSLFQLSTRKHTLVDRGQDGVGEAEEAYETLAGLDSRQLRDVVWLSSLRKTYEGDSEGYGEPSAASALPQLLSLTLSRLTRMARTVLRYHDGVREVLSRWTVAGLRPWQELGVEDGNLPLEDACNLETADAAVFDVTANVLLLLTAGVSSSNLPVRTSTLELENMVRSLGREMVGAAGQVKAAVGADSGGPCLSNEAHCASARDILVSVARESIRAWAHARSEEEAPPAVHRGKDSGGQRARASGEVLDDEAMDLDVVSGAVQDQRDLSSKEGGCAIVDDSVLLFLADIALAA